MDELERYTSLLESIRGGFVAVDDGWRVIYLNPTAESLLRLSRDRANGSSIWSWLPRTPAEIGETLRATMEDGIQRHLRGVRPEGRVYRGRVFDLWTHPVAGGGISILFDDVSERVQREKELARLAAEAHEANEAKSRFFAAISHELRTPLNAIVGYTHLLSTATYGDMPDAARTAADRASVCAEHLARLVDDVLLMTTAEIGKLPLVLGDLVIANFLPNIVEPLRHQAEAKGLAFEVQIQDDLPNIVTDAQRLRQVVISLLSNAVKFTERGEVRVEVALRHDPLGTSSDGTEYVLFPDPKLEIRVIDTGTGIAPEDTERIFGPFEQIGDPARSQSMVRGTGLGLPIARQLAGLLSGELVLEETSDGGSVFVLRIPLKP
ncbi:MAG TPA: HAMP domain-containing sensor histidine kinase [Longimicrobiaceae bacterium]|nr:HAMP domain-containing sensor histidine kinase [Longimicrobiaceae bacterium]